MWKICQAFRARYRSFVPHCTQLIRQRSPTKLARFASGSDILNLESRERNSLTFPVGLFHLRPGSPPAFHQPVEAAACPLLTALTHSLPMIWHGIRDNQLIFRNLRNGGTAAHVSSTLALATVNAKSFTISYLTRMPSINSLVSNTCAKEK
jgi:hypothetical protein